jgi:hypothetical protein
MQWRYMLAFISRLGRYTSSPTIFHALRKQDSLMPAGEWIRCDLPEGFDVLAFRCNGYVVAARRRRVGFDWNIFQSLSSGESQRLKVSFHQALTPAVLEERDIAHALEWAEQQIAKLPKP